MNKNIIQIFLLLNNNESLQIENSRKSFKTWSINTYMNIKCFSYIMLQII